MNAFLIVNCFDRPCERLIAQERDGKLYYVHPDFRDVKSYHGMPMDDATPIEAFGVRVEVRGNALHGKVVGPSIARYRDESARSWQGSGDFTIVMPNGEGPKP